MRTGEQPFFYVDPEKQPGNERLAFSAVPLDPWNAKHPLHSDVPYYLASLNQIDDLADRSFNLTPACHLSNELKEFVKMSLWSAQSQRIDYNHDNPIPDELRVADSRVERACLGFSSPEELLNIFLDYPQLQAIELAKLSHPFDSTATNEMTEMITHLLKKRLGAQYPTDNPRYKVKRNDQTIPALIVTRKVSAEVTMNGENFCIVERKSLLLRGDDAVVADYGEERQKRHGRLLTNVDKFDELTEKAESVLELDPHAEWLQPLTTSYYIHRVKTA